MFAPLSPTSGVWLPQVCARGQEDPWVFAALRNIRFSRAPQQRHDVSAFDENDIAISTRSHDLNIRLYEYTPCRLLRSGMGGRADVSWPTEGAELMPSQSTSRRRVLSLALAAIGSIGFSRAARGWTPQCPQGSIAPAPNSLPDRRGESLGSLATSAGLTFGVQASYVTNADYGNGIYDPIDQQLILREQPQFFAGGNAFRFQQLCPDRPDPNGPLKFTQKQYGVTDTWWQANDLTAIFKPHGVRARADALIWQESAPPWLATLPARGWETSRQFKSNLNYMTQFISATMKKIIQLSAGDPNYFYAISLINEPINYFNLVSGAATYTGGPFLPAGVPILTSGLAQYISTAFAKVDYYNRYWASALKLPATTAKLMINIPGTENDQFGAIVRPAAIDLVRKIKALGLKLDAVGLEAHLQPQMMNSPQAPDWTAFSTFLHQLGQLGVDIHITELDVLDYEISCAGQPGTAAGSDALTSLYYRTFLQAALAVPAVKSVALWDLSDRYSFYRYEDISQWFGYNQIARPKPANQWPQCATMPANAAAIACPRPVLFDDAYVAKSARQAVADAFAGAPNRLRGRIALPTAATPGLLRLPAGHD
eukprot:gene19742-20213_t